jgi:nucleoside-diphosphate-sugar epimerase
MGKKALVVGVTGIVGTSLVEHVLSRGWEVFGLSRRPPDDIEGLVPVAADLLDPPGLRRGLERVRPTHVFFATWSRHPTEAENIRVNGAMMCNLLEVLRPDLPGGPAPPGGRVHRRRLPDESRRGRDHQGTCAGPRDSKMTD